MGNVTKTREQVLRIWELKDAGANCEQAAREFGLSRDHIKNVWRVKDRAAYLNKYYDGNMFVPNIEQKLIEKHQEGRAPDPDIRGRFIGKLPDTVMIIPDLQFPFAHPDAIKFLSMVAQRYKPDVIVGIGDEVDCYFLSAYEKDPDALNASREYEVALQQCEELFKLFPKAYALHSNHGRGRLEGARKRGGLLRSMVPDYQTFIGAPRGWGFYDEVHLGDVIFRHGDGEKGLTKPFLLEHTPAEYGRHYSVVHGHVHEKCGRQATVTVGERDYWAAYTGALINPRAAAFGYTKARKAKLGCGIITHGEYKQVRLVEDDSCRWTGTGI